MSSSPVHKLEVDVEIKATAEQFHDMFWNKPHHVTHTSGEKVQGCELFEGDFGTLGSIIQWSYVHDGKAKKAKERVVRIDSDKNLITFEVLEGEVMDEYKTFFITLQVTPKSDGGEGSIVHWLLEYEKLHEGIDHPETLISFFNELSQDVDAHLIKEAVVHKLELDVEIKASAEQFHDMFWNKPHHITHTSAEKVQGCELLEGDFGTSGSIIRWNYFHDGKAKKAKQLVETVDSDKNLITFKMLEGELMDEYKTFFITIQGTPKSDGGEGSIVHWLLEYEKLHEGIDHPETLMQFFNELSQDIDAHLIKGD